MLRRSVLFRCLLAFIISLPLVLVPGQPANAATIEPYVTRFLKVTEPVELAVDDKGKTQAFSAEDLSEGKRLFQKNCLNCHVGGETLPNPAVSLSLTDLQGATPPRNTINGLVAYLRRPVTYDGSEETYWCREVPESWMPQTQVEKLAAFVLRAAETAPGWGVEGSEE